MDNPLVSIITPTLNLAKYLEACIQSVLNQSYPYIEHIFIDGGINACDFDYWLRVGKVFQIHRVEKVLSNFRLHKDSRTCSSGAEYMHAREAFMIGRRYGASIFSPSARRYFIYAIIRPLLPFLVRINLLIRYKVKW